VREIASIITDVPRVRVLAEEIRNIQGVTKYPHALTTRYNNGQIKRKIVSMYALNLT